MRDLAMEREIAMVVAHKHGRRKAHLGFHRDYIVDLAKILPTVDERDAFIAGFIHENERMMLEESK